MLQLLYCCILSIIDKYVNYKDICQFKLDSEKYVMKYVLEIFKSAKIKCNLFLFNKFYFTNFILNSFS